MRRDKTHRENGTAATAFMTCIQTPPPPSPPRFALSLAHRGLKKKEQKKLEMFQVGKEEEEKKGGDDGSNEDLSAPHGPPPSAEI